MSEEKKKAIELIDKFTQLIFDSGNTVSKPMVIDCAKLCINECLNHVPDDLDLTTNYLNGVLTELNKM